MMEKNSMVNRDVNGRVVRDADVQNRDWYAKHAEEMRCLEEKKRAYRDAYIERSVKIEQTYTKEFKKNARKLIKKVDNLDAKREAFTRALNNLIDAFHELNFVEREMERVREKREYAERVNETKSNWDERSSLYNREKRKKYEWKLLRLRRKRAEDIDNVECKKHSSYAEAQEWIKNRACDKFQTIIYGELHGQRILDRFFVERPNI